MREITIDAVNAFMNNNEFNRDNTKIEVDNFIGVTFLYLHGNIIAMKYHATGIIKISNSGWLSITTKDRLDGSSTIIQSYLNQ